MHAAIRLRQTVEAVRVHHLAVVATGVRVHHLAVVATGAGCGSTTWQWWLRGCGVWVHHLLVVATGALQLKTKRRARVRRR